jgi:hypothetical protein
MNSENVYRTDYKHWPGTTNMISDVERILLAAVEERAIQNANDEVQSAADVFEAAYLAWRDGDVEKSLADGLAAYISGGTFILERKR